MNMNQSRLIFILIGLSVASALAATCAAAGRRLVVNSPVSIGQLRLLEKEKEPVYWPRGGKYIAEAKGTVELPDGPVILMANELVAEHPEALATLGINSLAFVSLDNSGAGDNVIDYLGGIKDLKRIGAGDCELTDSGVAAMARFKQMNMLALNNCLIKGTTLGELGKLSNLSRLVLSGNHLEPAAYPQLGRLQNLQLLELSRVGADDARIMSLPILPKLTRLSLAANAGIKGACLSHLAKFPSLAEISFDGTSVDGVDLIQLKGSSVRIVSLDAGRINEGELKKLHKEMPNLLVKLAQRVRSKWPKELFAPLH